MVVGIHNYRDARQVDRLFGLLALPFVGRITGYAINRRQWTEKTVGDPGANR